MYQNDLYELFESERILAQKCREFIFANPHQSLDLIIEGCRNFPEVSKLHSHAVSRIIGNSIRWYIDRESPVDMSQVDAAVVSILQKQVV